MTLYSITGNDQVSLSLTFEMRSVVHRVQSMLKIGSRYKISDVQPVTNIKYLDIIV